MYKMFGFGVIATTLSILSFFPVIYKIHCTKNTDNFTILNLSLAILANLFWIMYGIKNKSTANILSGVLFTLMYSYIAIQK